MPSEFDTPRRGFFGKIAIGAAALASGAALPRLLAAAPDPGDDWMRTLTGKHRTVFDLSSHKNGKPLAQARNYLNGWRDAFHVPDAEVNLVIGIHGEGIPIVLNDALWSRFKLGEQYEMADAATKAPATVNVFTAPHVVAGGPLTAEQTVEALQARGVRFIVCMNTIAGATNKLSGAGFGAPADVRAALLGGLLPGVITVPAMVVAFTQLQERGLGYTKIA
ncbi:MAG: hypothetical protein ABJD07_03605 [Gemmatimonadaceae bacterium]